MLLLRSRRSSAAAVVAATAAAAALVGVGQTAHAHEPGTSAVLVDIEPHAVTAELQIPLDRLAIATELPLGADAPEAHGDTLVDYIAGNVAVTGEDQRSWPMEIGPLSVEVIDSTDHLTSTLTFTPPDGVVTGFALQYSVVLERIASHDVVVAVGQAGEERVVVGTLDHLSDTIGIDVGDVGGGFGRMVGLGLSHVLDGADHLLFLLVLLLPAPLIVGDNRHWSATGTAKTTALRVIAVATSFTIGHSITLVLAARGWVTAPTRPIEIVIALSIAVGAIHALRPLVTHGEEIIAGGFGLIHGLAFAGLLDGLGLGAGSWRSLAGFNLGVELAQLATIVAVFPSLYVLSRTPVYSRVRQVGGGCALVASAGWLAERVGLASNPLGPIERAAMAQRATIVAVLAVLAIAVLLAHARPRRLSGLPQQ